MIEEGDDAPTFSAPMTTPRGDIEEFSLADATDEGPVVLAFFPGAFTSVCASELTTFRDRLEALTDDGASLYGVSVDSPFALEEFATQNDLNFPLVSDIAKDVIDSYDVAMDFDALGVEGVAKRAVFVIDENETITYAWVSDDPGVEPDYEAVESAAADA